LRKALSERLRAGDGVVVDDLSLPSNKTRDFIGLLSALGWKGSALVVAHKTDKKSDDGFAECSECGVNDE